MHFKAPGKCPVCDSNLTISKLICEKCETEISGKFSPCRFCSLDDKLTKFLEVFLKNRGSIKDVEREMGISYPTVRNLLDGLLESLHLNGKSDSKLVGPDTPEVIPLTRKQVLEKVNSGEITAQEAVILLKKIGKGD